MSCGKYHAPADRLGVACVEARELCGVGGSVGGVQSLPCMWHGARGVAIEPVNIALEPPVGVAGDSFRERSFFGAERHGR